MTRTNMAATRVRPDAAHLLLLRVLRRARLSPSFVRVTVGGGDIAEFTPMGFDQWFRLFLPLAGGALARLPQHLDTLSYLRFLAISRGERPLLRNYTVAAFRADGPGGPEIDIDFVVHGTGPAATWALSCEPGAALALIDEGITFRHPAGCGDATTIVADESALPAAAGILASLPARAYGVAVLEVPDAGDRRDLPAPAGIDVRWVVRGEATGAPDAQGVPGALALHEASTLAPPEPDAYAWVAGEQALASGMRRHWARAGLPKQSVTFTGYWRGR